MTQHDLFITIFAAALGANLLTIVFVWAWTTYGRLEREGRDKTEGAVQLGLILFVIAAFGLSTAAVAGY